jgi:hypothetical protein
MIFSHLMDRRVVRNPELSLTESVLGDKISEIFAGE